MTISLIREVSRSLDEREEELEKRLKSFNLYTSLPLEPSPLYTRYVDAKVCEVDLNTLAEANEQTKFSLPNYASQVIHGGKLLSRKSIPGVKLQTIQEAKREGLDLDLLDPSENRFSALIKALYSGGHVLLVDKGVVVNEPVHLVTLVDTSYVSRNIIVVGEGAEVDVVEEIYSTQQPRKDTFHSYSDEILLRENSSLRIATIQAADHSTKLFNVRKTVSNRDATLNWATTYLGGSLHLGRVEHKLSDENAAVKDIHISLLADTQILDLTTDLLHQAPKTNGSILVKLALKDSSKAVAKGIIRIPSEGKQSNAYLAQHAIMLDPNASGITIPSLEILNNDVKATHSSSISQLDEEQLFYLMSKGLSWEEARRMITLGFFEHALVKVSMPSVREGVRRMLEDKWLGKITTFTPTHSESTAVGSAEMQDIFEGHYKYR